jgi:hypothetical protein
MSENDDSDRCLKAGHVQRLLQIEDCREWGGGLELRDDGIYRRAVDADTLATLPLPDQIAARGAGAGLVLRLPCTLDQFAQFVADEGLADEWVQRRVARLRAIAGTRAVKAAPAITVSAGRVLKKRVLVAELRHEWPSIELDLSEASRNNLKAAAHSGDGWHVERARDWADRHGKLRKTDSQRIPPGQWAATVHQLGR